MGCWCGGATVTSSPNPGGGGGGAYLSCTIDVSHHSQLYLLIGEAGKMTGSTWSGGGTGNESGNWSLGNGGGLTAISVDNPTSQVII